MNYYLLILILIQFVLLQSCNNEKPSTEISKTDTEVFQEKKKSAQWVTTYSIDERGEGPVTDGYKNGYWKYYYKNKNSVKRQGAYLKDLKTDWWQYFDSAGILLKEGHYSADKVDGYWKFYKSAVMEKEGNYENGSVKGTWKFYDAKGNLNNIINYE